MNKRGVGVTELARVVHKSKVPTYTKSSIALMSDGSVWEKHNSRSPSGKKIRGEWTHLNKIPELTRYTRKMFLNIFIRGGWKQV